MANLLSVHLQFTVLIIPLVSFGHSIVCPSSIYGFYYPFGIFWSLYCLSILNLPFLLPLWYLLSILLSVHLQFTVLITPLVSFWHSIVCPSSIYRFYYPFGIFLPLYCLSILNLPFLLPLWYLLSILLSVHLQFIVFITPLVSFGHSVVCPSSIYRFDYPFGIFWPLYCLSIFNLPFLLPLWYLLVIVLSVHLQFTVFITPLVSFGHSIVYPSSIYHSVYPFGIFCPLYCLPIFN